MAKGSLQQIGGLKPLLRIAFLMFLVISFSSCVQLKYTDYGKPFDFLKSKNQYHARSIEKKDTASVFQSKDPKIKHSLTLEANKTYSSNEIDIQLEINQQQDSSLMTHEVYREKKRESKLNSILQTHNLKKLGKLKLHDNTSINYTKSKGPGWWKDFWKGFWNFVLKWLLIFLCFFIILALIIWGIYVLITVLIGPLAATIFLIVVLTFLYILFEFG